MKQLLETLESQATTLVERKLIALLKASTAYSYTPSNLDRFFAFLTTNSGDESKTIVFDESGEKISDEFKELILQHFAEASDVIESFNYVIHPAEAGGFYWTHPHVNSISSTYAKQEGAVFSAYEHAILSYRDAHNEELKHKGNPRNFSVKLKMEDGKDFIWSGEADDKNHAEGQAIAEAVSKTGEQVLEVLVNDF